MAACHHFDIPPMAEFIEMIADTGAGLYAGEALVDLFGLEQDEFIPRVKDIVTVGELYGPVAGGHINLT